jgi:hypothetical protein
METAFESGNVVVNKKTGAYGVVVGTRWSVVRGGLALEIKVKTRATHKRRWYKAGGWNSTTPLEALSYYGD